MSMSRPQGRRTNESSWSYINHSHIPIAGFSFSHNLFHPVSANFPESLSHISRSGNITSEPQSFVLREHSNQHLVTA